MAQLKDTVVSGNLRVTDTALTNTAQVTTIKAPTSSGGSTYGPGTSGQVLKSNGTSAYWASDNNSDTKVNVTLATTTKAYLLGTSTTPTATAQAVTSLADTGVYLDTTAGQLTATKLSSKIIKNALTGSGTAGSDSGGTYYPAKWTFNSGITIADGEVIIIKIPVAGHSNGVYVSVNNGTNYYPVAATGNTRLTTHYGSGQYVALMFKSDGSVGDIFPLAGGTSRTTVSGGAWVVLNFYDSGNTFTSAYCTTTGATAAKTATCSSYVLLNKSWLHVLISASNTSASALTLNVNGKGAKPIYINGSASSASNYTLPAGTYLVYYDGTNYYFRTDGALIGPLQTNDITIASGDKLVVTDSSDSSKIARASISFDGSTATKCLTQKGTWESFTNNSGNVTGSGLTADTIILGNGSSGIKSSGKTITTSITDASTTVPTSSAVVAYVSTQIAAADALIYKGTIGKTGATITTKTLPNDTAKIGWTYKAIDAGDYTVGTGTTTGTTTVHCEIGDMIICLTDGSSSVYATWTVVQNNVDLVGTSGSIGLIKNGSSVTDATGYTASPIISGIPYYKDTTYSNGTGLNLDGTSFSVKYGTAAGTACVGNDSRLSDARTPTSHTHGNIQNGGTLQTTTDITIASGDKLVVTDSSDSNKIARTSTAFGSDTTKYLRNDGTWTVPPDNNTKNTAGSTDTSSQIFLIGATSQAANPQTYSHDTAYVGTNGHLYSNSKQVVNLSDSQALTNKTYNGYTLGAACAKGVTDNSTSTAVTSSDTNLITGRTLYYAGYAKVTFDTTNEMMIFT